MLFWLFPQNVITIFCLVLLYLPKIYYEISNNRIHSGSCGLHFFPKWIMCTVCMGPWLDQCVCDVCCGPKLTQHPPLTKPSSPPKSQLGFGFYSVSFNQLGLSDWMWFSNKFARKTHNTMEHRQIIQPQGHSPQDSMPKLSYFKCLTKPQIIWSQNVILTPSQRLWLYFPQPASIRNNTENVILLKLLHYSNFSSSTPDLNLFSCAVLKLLPAIEPASFTWGINWILTFD